MYKYKTKNGRSGGIVPGVGVITNGVILSDHKLEGPNLVLVEDNATAPEPLVALEGDPNPPNVPNPNPEQPHAITEPENTQNNGDIEL